MRQTMILFASLLLLPFSAHAQENPEIMAPYEAGFSASPKQSACAMLQNEDEDEYEYKEMTMRISPRDNDNQYNVTTGAPIVTTRPYSKSEAVYMYGTLMLMKGDKVTKIGYTGYNPGSEVERHVIIWMQNVDHSVKRVEGGFAPVDDTTKVFEGDIVIKSGGDFDHWIQLADITLDTPFEYVNQSGVRITTLSYGEASDHDVYFAHSSFKSSGLCSASDQMEDVSDYPQSDFAPQLKYTVATKLDCLTGQVTDQDGNPIAGAEVTLTSCRWQARDYRGLTDDEGHYEVKAPGNNTFLPSAKATGFVPYVEAGLDYSFEKDDDLWATFYFEDKKMDFTLFNALDFHAGEIGTIILPVEPDPTLGKYYRLDHLEDNVLVFEREPIPQANVPYLLIAHEDCRVDLSEMDLTGTPGKTVLDNIWFIGSYVNTDLVITTNEGVWFFDHTPDCGNGRIGGCRAYILLNLLYGPFYYKLLDTNGVEQLILATKGDSVDCYDLQGRKLPSGTIPRGIFISNGKKQLGR